MKEEEKDPQLGPPQEANTGKHINFLEAEEDEERGIDRSTDDESPTKRAWEEMRQDLKSEQSKSNNE
jgi:hypothetical protein